MVRRLMGTSITLTTLNDLFKAHYGPLVNSHYNSGLFAAITKAEKKAAREKKRRDRNEKLLKKWFGMEDNGSK